MNDVRARMLVGMALLGLAGCTQLQMASSGEIGCKPKTIQISQKQHQWSTSAWVASCNGKEYQCSSVATGNAVDYSCKPLDGSGPVSAGEEKGEPADFDRQTAESEGQRGTDEKPKNDDDEAETAGDDTPTEGDDDEPAAEEPDDSQAADENENESDED